MFATRFIRVPLLPATRSFSTASRSRTPFFSQPLRNAYSTRTYPRPSSAWQATYRRAQTRQYARQAFNYQRYQASKGIFQRWAAQPTFYYQIAGIGGVCGGVYIYNLEEVPVSGRKRFNIISPEIEQQMAQSMYQETLQEFGSKIMPAYTREHQQVQRVLNRLVPHSGLEDEKWEIHVIDDSMKNAFVIPGGKVFVFRGILDICQGDDGLAAVLGHEIAHNVAHHAAERGSRVYILLFAGILVSSLLGVDLGLVRLATSLTFELPGSRKEESEADYIGLLMMAESCYDPEAAMGLWARMEKEERGAPPQFLSTHPSSHNRLEQIRDWLPQAEVKRDSSDCGIMTGYADDFRRTMNTSRW